VKTAKRLLLILGVAILALAAALAVNTMRLDAQPLGQKPAPGPVDAAAVQRLSEAVRIATISTDGAPPAPQALAAFHAFLERSFPRVHVALKREQVAGGSLFYTWEGSDPSAPALLLAAHQDVVPIDAGSETRWSHLPFAGVVRDGFIWGRGTLDDKGSLLAILEAVERLLASGHRPRQTVYLAFGHDEERGGTGAMAMAAILEERGARLGLVLDEGASVIDGVIAGVDPPVAMIGVADKGYVSIEIVATGPGGHSSQPTADNPAVRVARAVTAITDSPMPARTGDAVDGLLDAIAPYTNGAMRVALANRWLTAPLIKRQLLASPTSAAALRTTTAATIIQTGTKENVLPQRARAVVNHRILPGETIKTVLAHDRAAVDDAQVSLRPLPRGFDPSPTVSKDGVEYQRLASAIRDTFPEAVVAPGMVLAATDLRHYRGLAGSPLMFGPLVLGPKDLERIHGNDERIAIADYMRAIAFYERLISGSPQPDN